MTDLSQMIRCQTGFVRGLAQSVLERARAIRSSLPATTKVEAKTKAKAPAKKAARKPTPKRAAAATKAKAKKGKKTKGS